MPIFNLSLPGEENMPEPENNRKIYSLLEISSGISRAIQQAFPGYYWVKAEIAKLNYYPKSGHCYPDLVEKHNGLVKAQVRANIWAGNFNKINQKFREVTGGPLKDGLKILFLAKVNYHEHYGLALNIFDVEPSFTLGEMAREKQLTVERLKREGLFEENKNRRMPLLPKRVAVISVETSKGFHDFKNVLENNAWQYRFQLTLFPALLQGDGAVASVTGQLHAIALQKNNFDVIAIIRGGGGDVGLNAYDSYSLAKTVALSPLPVITGIGHSTNLTVTQMVAFANKITPTEAAHFLIQQFHNFSVRVQDAEKKTLRCAGDILSGEKKRFFQMARMFEVHTRNLLDRHKTHGGWLARNLEKTSQQCLEKEKARWQRALSSLTYYPAQRTGQEIVRLGTFSKIVKIHTYHALENTAARLRFYESKLELLQPENVLKKGYSLSFVNGKLLHSVKQAAPGGKMVTRLSDGEIQSKIE